MTPSPSVGEGERRYRTNKTFPWGNSSGGMQYVFAGIHHAIATISYMTLTKKGG